MKETLLPGPHFSNVGYRYPPGKSLSNGEVFRETNIIVLST